MLSWTLILVVMVLVAIGAFWQHSLGVRERANQAAQDACARMGVQFLDGTVAFAGLRLARNDAQRLTLRRTYVFDYTAEGLARRQGFVVMLGARVEHIGFERDSEPTLPHAVTQRSATDDGKVLNLADWRRRRAQHADSGALEPKKPGPHSDNGW